jgi:diaminohydroxyphosphoribosylaminopyrimidine deaminase/5-amino-6-(5-phosphoribosylamino)uracil reductase
MWGDATRSMRTALQSDAETDERRAWSLLRALAQTTAREGRISETVGLELDAQGRARITSPRSGWIRAHPELANGWSTAQPLEPAAAKLLDLFMPLCIGPRSGRLVVGHLGQSADGHIATFDGSSKFITGEEDIRHTHRLRALFDVVLVGASTVAIDDPQLTTRLVPGNTPVRVVLDPQCRLQRQAVVFRDRDAHTIVVQSRPRPPTLPEHVETLVVGHTEHGLDLRELLRLLRERGLGRVFIEGGGVTVSEFMRAGLLDRLQIAVAPVQLGAAPQPVAWDITPEQLPALGRTRRFLLGDDVLFDTELHAG